jgi:hypothetical protein
MIRYTKKVRDILNFIDEYGFITSNICANIFFKNTKCQIDLARRCLRKLANNKDVIANKHQYGKELIYQFKRNVVSDHKYYLLNFYSEIYKQVTEVKYFKLEETWGSRRSDAHIIFNNIIDGDDSYKSYLIEFDKFHKTNPNEKYNEIYDSGLVQEWYNENQGIDNYFPDVIIINYSGKCIKSNRDDFNIVGLDYNFTDILHKVII